MLALFRPLSAAEATERVKVGGAAYNGSMPLPFPNTDEIERFKALYEANFGVQLDSGQAQDLARRALQIFYLKTCGFKRLPPHPHPAAKPGPAKSRPAHPPAAEWPGPTARSRRSTTSHALPPLRP